MKKIEAIIKPIKLDEVQNALEELGIEEITVCEVKAVSRQNVHTEVFRGTEFPVDFLREIKIELVVSDSQKDAVVAAIIKVTGATRSGSGRVFVSHIDEAVRPRAKTMEEHLV